MTGETLVSSNRRAALATAPHSWLRHRPRGDAHAHQRWIWRASSADRRPQKKRQYHWNQPCQESVGLCMSSSVGIVNCGIVHVVLFGYRHTAGAETAETAEAAAPAQSRASTAGPRPEPNLRLSSAFGAAEKPDQPKARCQVEMPRQAKLRTRGSCAWIQPLASHSACPKPDLTP